MFGDLLSDFVADCENRRQIRINLESVKTIDGVPNCCIAHAALKEPVRNGPFNNWVWVIQLDETYTKLIDFPIVEGPNWDELLKEREVSLREMEEKEKNLDDLFVIQETLFWRKR